MTALSRQLSAAGRLDFGEVTRSRWLPFATIVYALLAGALLFAGMRTSEILGFTGMSRVLLSLTHVLLVVLPLLALAGTTQVVPRAREDGTLELLFSHPLSRSGYLIAVTLTRFLVLAVPLLVLLFAMALGARAFGESVPWAMLGRSGIVSVALLWAFTGVGIAVSTGTRNQAKAIVYALVIWALTVALLDLGIIGLLLQWKLEPRAVFVLAALNPVEDARLALLSGIEPSLATLGPVGFFLVHRLGGAAMFAIGVLWPVAVGTGAWLWALLRFRRGDVL
ncbi:MAG: ABC transporter permease subunit [Myxococcales bacterium]|nr:ABC transporter permease subunit [Myxococcales bacterium]